MAHAVVDMNGKSTSIQEQNIPFLNYKVKTDCKTWLLSEPVFPNFADSTQHWGLSAALDGIAAYQNWVSGWLLPVAFLWIYENRENICKSKGWVHGLPDDIDEVVKGALEFAMKQKLFDGNFLVVKKPDVLKTKNANGTWSKTSKELRHQIHEKCEYPDFSSLPKAH